MLGRRVELTALAPRRPRVPDRAHDLGGGFERLDCASTRSSTTSASARLRTPTRAQACTTRSRACRTARCSSTDLAHVRLRPAHRQRPIGCRAVPRPRSVQAITTASARGRRPPLARVAARIPAALRTATPWGVSGVTSSSSCAKTSTGATPRWRSRTRAGQCRARSPCRTAGHRQASIASRVCGGGPPPDQLLADSDLAMYWAKERAVGGVRLFERDPRTPSWSGCRVRGRSATPVEHDEFLVYYQRSSSCVRAR